MARCPHMSGDAVCDVCKELARLQAIVARGNDRSAKSFRLRASALIHAGEVTIAYDDAARRLHVEAPVGTRIYATRADRACQAAKDSQC